MKTSVTLILLLISACIHAQDLITQIKAGPAYNYIKQSENDHIERLGYYAGFDVEQKITQVLWVTGDLYFLNQSNRFEEISMAVNSVNLGFGFNVYPVRNFNLMTGVDVGFILNSKIEGEDVPDTIRNRWGYVFGAAYKISESFKLHARYVTTINTQWFSSTTQLGIAYKISR